MKTYKWIIILVNLIILLAFFNSGVKNKEIILSEGQIVLLELAPVDPRSLMQGDYMRLNYAISRIDTSEYIAKRGFCVVKLDSEGVGNRIRIQEKRTPLNADEFLIEYNKINWRGISIGAESYFFQEGEAEKYEEAKYGGVKIDTKGNSLLIGLYDKNLEKIE